MNDFTWDTKIWKQKPCVFVPTLQYFITTKCNTRCKECFMKGKLGQESIDMVKYQEVITKYTHQIDKVILLGGEPTTHENLKHMITYNHMAHGLRTTIYTNGFNLEPIREVAHLCTIRVGIVGLSEGEKTLKNIINTKNFSDFKAELVFMARKNNINEIQKAAKLAEELGFSKFFLSSMVDVHETGDYWKSSNSCLNFDEYKKVAQDFIDNYQGNLKEIQTTVRGNIKVSGGEWNTCRFLNLFPNGDQIICPYDIALDKKHDGEFKFCTRKCQKNDRCLLQKLILTRNV